MLPRCLFHDCLCSARVTKVQQRMPTAGPSASCSMALLPSHGHSFCAEGHPSPTHWVGSYSSFETHFKGVETKKPRSHPSLTAPPSQPITRPHSFDILNSSHSLHPQCPVNSPHHVSPRQGHLSVPNSGLSMSQTQPHFILPASCGHSLESRRNCGCVDSPRTVQRPWAVFSFHPGLQCSHMQNEELGLHGL